MGSIKNKINNKKKKKMETEALNELIDLKKKMKEQYAAEKYVEAIDTMAEIARHKKMDPEIMLMGATCYFMAGDYERATTWTNNTLSYDPQNVGARILLGRLCIIEERWEQGLKILNFVADNQQSVMSEKNKEDFVKVLGYYNLNVSEDMAKYPSLMEYFKEHCSGVEASQKDNEKDEPNKDKAKAAVNRLKALLNKSKGNKTKKEVASVAPATLEKETSVKTEKKGDSEAPDYFINQVMSSNIALREKVQSLNNFASGLYLNDDYDGALLLLKKALELDSGDPFVLRNVAYVCVAMKDKEKALEFAKNLPMLDFGLLKSIKELGNE